MSAALSSPVRACAALDPLTRKHLVLVALALQAAGADADDAELVRHVDPLAMEALVQERLDGATGELLLRYLHALSAEQCRSLAQARNRLELELSS